MPSLPLTKPTAAPTLTCIQVDLNPLQLAVPIDRVEKVVRQSEIVGESIVGESPVGPDTSATAVPTGIIYYAETAVTLLNLEQHLLQRPTTAGYYLILRASTGEWVAIPIPAAPNLIELPSQSLKTLPSTYRRANLLGIASHVARTEAGSTVFVLDVDYLINRWCIPQAADLSRI